MIAVVDTNSSPDKVDYVIPGNDDSIRAIQLYVSGVADAIMDGRTAVLESAGDANDFVEVEEDTPAPKKKASTMSLTRPKMRLSRVKKLTTPAARLTFLFSERRESEVGTENP